MKRISAIVATVGLLSWGASCNKHSWEDEDGKPGTKHLFVEHHHDDGHGDGDHADGDKDHGHAHGKEHGHDKAVQGDEQKGEEKKAD